MKIMIIANGEFPTRKEIREGIAAADRVVCCDGAFGKFLTNGVVCGSKFQVSGSRFQVSGLGAMPVTVVGDGDSLTQEVLEEAERMGIAFEWVKVEEQDYNDLTKAVRVTMERWPVEAVDIVGATGLREDHTLGNISLLGYYTEQYPEVKFRILTDFGEFHAVQGEGRFPSRPGQQVSLFSLTPQVPVSTTGLRWPLDNRCLTQWWQGSLNEATGDTVHVSGGLVLIFLERE